ncbi:hypothetical protein [Spirosoma sordidisoli]|uniref:Uncharacterized protein n=1 Tax=Spirosoma sordidisoli TaxID=2502893 RepID=A0A4V1RVD1_9BACT|nr:hypothetical protein [Spirosoma sordidisoli]RYC66348.1 hypothetical protein EQG79_30205 [Spirosoma sordidisoli]
MGLKDVLSDISTNAGVSFHQPQSGVRTPGSNYVALGLVQRNAIPDFGQQYTPPGGGAPVAVTGANIVGFIKQLAFLDRAVFFGNGMLSGKKGLPEGYKESAKYGTRTMERETGDVKENAEFDFKHFYLNIGFFNGLRSRLRQWDVYVFTQSTVFCLRWDSDEVVFHSIGHLIDADITKEIAGKFSISWTSEGEKQPVTGVAEASLAEDTMRYSFGAEVVTGLVAVPGQPDRYTLTGAVAGSLTRTVTEGGTVTYVIFRDAKTPITTEQVTINSLTGKVDFAATLAAGRYTFTVVGYNTSGVFGSYTITVDKL